MGERGRKGGRKKCMRGYFAINIRGCKGAGRRYNRVKKGEEE